MQIERIVGGFIQYFDDPVIERIFCDYKDYENGICTVYFHDKPPKELHIGCSTYNSQYGTPFSNDGSKLFVGAWEKELEGVKKGLRAYDIETGSVLWRLDESRIRHIFVYSSYLITIKALANILKVDINNGSVLGNVKSGTIESIYDLGFPYILANTISGKLSIVDIEKMQVVKNYKWKELGPSIAHGSAILDATLRGNVLYVTVFEKPWTDTISFTRPNEIEMVIDADFYNM